MPGPITRVTLTGLPPSYASFWGPTAPNFLNLIGPGTFIVDPLAFTISTNGTPIVLDGDWDITINGAVGSMAGVGQSGIYLDSTAATAVARLLTVGLDGYIFAEDGYGFQAQHAINIKNAGTITGNLNAVRYTSFADGNLTITNSGLIRSAATAIEFQDGNEGIHTIKNSGTIDATGGVAILASATNANSIEKLTNTGKIFGDIELGAGNDTFTNTGTINGIIDMGAGNDTFTGGSGSETVQDGDGADVVKLGGGHDIYKATGSAFSEVPTLTSGDLIDVIDGGTGIDTYDASGSGHAVFINLDTTILVSGFPARTAVGIAVSGEVPVLIPTPLSYDRITGFENVIGSSKNDAIIGNSAANQLAGGDGSDGIEGRGGNDVLLGEDGSDGLYGGLGNDFLYGGSGNDDMYGDSSATLGGADVLDGGIGNDVLYGGAGRDELTGGAGDDFFAFTDKRESGLTAATRDTIVDFEGAGVSGGDQIDLSIMDADLRTPSSDESFSFTTNGTAGFTVGVAGQLRFQFAYGGTIIWGETNGDGKADFSILVKGIHVFDTSPTQDDFFL